MWRLQGMEGAVVGSWGAHGEGQAKFPDDAVRTSVLQQGLAPIRWRSLSSVLSADICACICICCSALCELAKFWMPNDKASAWGTGRYSCCGVEN